MGFQMAFFMLFDIPLMIPSSCCGATRTPGIDGCMGGYLHFFVDMLINDQRNLLQTVFLFLCCFSCFSRSMALGFLRFDATPDIAPCRRPSCSFASWA